MIEQLKEIFYKNKKEEIIPFLKQLTEKEKKKLATLLGKEENYHLIHKSKTLFFITGIYCCTFTQFKRITTWLSFSFEKDMGLIDDFLNGYCPEWFSDYFNQKASEDFAPLEYEELLYLQEKGYLQPSRELLAKTLGSRNATQTLPIEKSPVILKEHIWTLFEYENNIGYTDYYYENKEGEKFHHRIHELVAYTNEGKIERRQLIKACLQTVNYNFKKNQLYWYIKLLTIINPTPEELIELQDELYHVLTGGNTVFLNQCLQEIKKIISHPSFQPNAFAEMLPLLLSQTVKKTLQLSLQIMEKIVQNYPEQKEDYVNEVTMLFINKDQTIQTKTAKFILQYGKPSSPELQKTLIEYAEYILPSIKQQLNEFTKKEETISQEKEPQIIKEQAYEVIISDENRIPVVNKFEELLYFAIQAFSGSEDFYPLMLPYYLLLFDKKLTGEQVEQLEPVYKKILQSLNGWSVDRALSDDVLASFMGSYAQHLALRYPEQSKRILQLVEKGIKTDLSHWQHRHKDDLFRYPVFYHLTRLWEAIRKGNCYHPLSIPTHTPLWIDPLTLVNRLIHYQQEGIEPDNYDLQAAIQSCCLQETTEARTAAQVLTGELRELLLFLLGEKEFDVTFVQHPAWWVTAAFTRYKGNLPGVIRETGWSIPEVFSIPLTQWEIRGPEKHLHIFGYNSFFVLREQTDFDYLDQFYLYKRLNTITFKGGDMYRLLISHPYHHQQLLARFLERVTRNDDYSNNEGEMIKLLEAIQQLKQPFGEMEHLAVILSFFNKQKAIAQYGAELCIESIRNRWSDPALLGKTLGKIITSAWFPLKRFTTLLQNNMLGNEIDIPLLEMIESTLKHTRQTVNGFKVIPEVYKELLINTNRKPALNEFPLLKEWESNSGLKKIFKELTLLANGK